MFLWGKNNATFHWINEGIHSINAEISISVPKHKPFKLEIVNIINTLKQLFVLLSFY